MAVKKEGSEPQNAEQIQVNEALNAELGANLSQEFAIPSNQTQYAKVISWDLGADYDGDEFIGIKTDLFDDDGELLDEYKNGFNIRMNVLEIDRKSLDFKNTSKRVFWRVNAGVVKNKQISSSLALDKYIGEYIVILGAFTCLEGQTPPNGKNPVLYEFNGCLDIIKLSDRKVEMINEML